MEHENTQSTTDRPRNVRMIRMPAVMVKTGLSKSAIYGRIRASDFPAPVPLGPHARAIGFVELEVEDWLSNLIRRSRRATHQAH